MHNVVGVCVGGGMGRPGKVWCIWNMAIDVRVIALSDSLTTGSPSPSVPGVTAMGSDQLRKSLGDYRRFNSPCPASKTSSF